MTENKLEMARTPRILERAGELLSNYDVLYCDVWGVVHNGHVAFANACTALEKFRERGGTVILVSNAPVPKARVANMLASRRVPESAWDDIVSSGDIALKHVEERQFKRLYGIGPKDRDKALFAKLPADLTHLDHAEAVICTGLNDDRTEHSEDYRPLLSEAQDRGLPFVCANPDLVVDVGGTLVECAGAIAEIYQTMGGDVFWAGKPYPVAYNTARDRAEAIRGAPVSKDRALVIGDALRTDIMGAKLSGHDAIFVASGIHRHETMAGEDLSEENISKLFSGDAPPALAAMRELAW